MLFIIYKRSSHHFSLLSFRRHELLSSLVVVLVDGASNIGYAILFWFMMNAPASDTKIEVAKAVSLGFGVSCLVSIVVQMSGEIGPLGWSTVALYAIFSGCYGYFGFVKGAEA